MLKERYLEENIMKTIDRAIHSDDYNNLKDDLQLYRAQKRQLAPEIENLKLQYASAQNSPQGPALKLVLNSKLNDLQVANDKLSIYKDMGRQGLGVEPEEYKRKRAEKQGMVVGGLTGLGAGGLAGLGTGEAIFNESEEIKEGNTITFTERILEEAAGVGSSSGTSFGGQKITERKVGPTVGPKLMNSLTNKKPKNSQPNTPPPNTKRGFWNKTLNKVDNLNLGTPSVESAKLRKKQLGSDLSKKTDQAGDWIKKKFMGDNPGEIKQTLSDIGNKTKDYFKPNDPSNRSRPANWINKLGQNKNMPGGGAGTAAGLAAGTLGLGGLGVAGLNAMFGGDDDIEVPEVEAPEVEVPVPPITPTQAPSLLDKMPGGKVGAGVLGGLGAAGAGKLLHDKLKK